MKTIIIEDELHAQNALRKMLRLLVPDINILGVFATIKEAVPFLKQETYDLLFLDIQLKDGTAFELLEQLDDTAFVLIFTTAYDEYALKAFKANATDYLLKPINPEELEKALIKAQLQIEKRTFFQGDPANFKLKPQRIVLKTIDQRFIVPIKDILHLEADGAYTIFHTTTDKILVSKNLKYYQEILQDYDFIRCHQSHLVSQAHIKSLKTNSLLLSNGDELPIAHRKKSLFRSF